jgi:hypothetical protein
MLLELNAAVGDMLSLNTDRMFETQIDYAKNVNLFYLWQELLVLKYQENVQV